LPNRDFAPINMFIGSRLPGCSPSLDRGSVLLSDLRRSSIRHAHEARAVPKTHCGAHDMATGTIKWYNPQKGYGFIQPDDGSKDVFVHVSAVERAGLGQLNEGQKLSYELERGQQGKTSAVNLREV